MALGSTRGIYCGRKSGRCQGLTNLPASCADCVEILGASPSYRLKGLSRLSSIRIAVPFRIQSCKRGRTQGIVNRRDFRTLARCIRKVLINMTNKTVCNLAETQTGWLMVGLRVLTGKLQKFYFVVDYEGRTSDSATCALAAMSLLVYSRESLFYLMI